MDQQKNFEKSSNVNSQNASQTQNDWMSYSYNRSSAYSSPEKSTSSFSSHQTSPSTAWNGSSSSSSESSWSSNDMHGMSRWPSSASVSSMSSMKSSKTYWSDTSSSMRSNSIPSAPSSSRSNSFDERTKRQFYASHSIFINNLRSDSSDDSFSSEFDQFYVNKK
ncbi:uncharacterized protein LOC129570929 [Sitodiplosis mosellana]|uniref:uncharacterized protein LOC129570929 n=1 Tax=Sitodiplosis mosellana TaxID=263140 RepID=UPI002444CA54|nr:uncharacterized protein LOC129570929 [Sitodiplosis mosellana]